MASSDCFSLAVTFAVCSSMIFAEERDTPLLKSTSEDSSSERIQFFARRGLTIIRSSGKNSMKFTPPNVAAY